MAAGYFFLGGGGDHAGREDDLYWSILLVIYFVSE